MWRTAAMLSCFLMLVWACLVSSQSDAACPANAAMGLCTEVPKPCFSDNDCVSGEICCPEACSRSCKPRYSMSFVEEGSIPDLLNDPSVYVGKCPDASCYSLFGGEPNECSTSNLCPKGQACCNDGCKNVCRWKPEYAARIAHEQARARQHQQLIIQKQQQEMRRRQQEMYLQQQRQIAAAEQSRKQAEARAAAEAELAAQSVSLSKTAPQPSRSSDSFLDKFVSEPQIGSRNMGQLQAQAQQQQAKSLDVSNNPGYANSNKKDNLPNSLVNHINSPANFNPYALLSQQNVQSKAVQEGLLSFIQSVPSASVRQNLANAFPDQQSTLKTAHKTSSAHPLKQALPSNPTRTIYPGSPQTSARNAPSLYQYPKPAVSYPNLNQSPTYLNRQLAPAQRLPPAYPGQQTPSAYPARRQSNPYSNQNGYPAQFYPNQISPALPYRSVGQYASPATYREQQRQDSLNSFLMYQALM